MSQKQPFLIIISIALLAVRVGAQTSPKMDSPKPPQSPAATAPKTASIEDRVEQYLRNVYTWGPDYKIKIGPTKPSPIHDLLEIPFTVSMGEQSQTAVVYSDKTGQFLIRGEISDMLVDPFADVRAKLHPGNSPSMGPENAKVTLIEFADFECPSCRQLDLILRDFMARHPEIRLVYKNFPLTEIHPWAMTAAIAAQCTYQQNPATFWKMHDAIFDAQDLITPSNVWDKMTDLGSQLGLNMEAYKACMADPTTTNLIAQTIEEGHSLNVTGTPTTFINARRVVGPNQTMIEQSTRFESGI